MKLRTLILTASLGLVVAPGAWANTVLFDNIGKPVAHTDTISGPVWLAQSFITDGQSYTLDSATLLLRQTAPGSAQVDIYSGSSRPTIVVGILSSPAAYSASLTPVTFTASGISLAANSSYWVAIHGLGAGSYEWAWTQDNTGGGVGFSIPLAFSLDAGANWTTTSPWPYNMTVRATVIPEPNQWALVAILGLVGCLLLQRPAKAR